MFEIVWIGAVPHPGGSLMYALLQYVVTISNIQVGRILFVGFIEGIGFDNCLFMVKIMISLLHSKTW